MSTLVRLFGRRSVPAPVLVSVSSRYVPGADGQWRRVCVLQLPCGELVERPVSDERLVALGVVAVAA
jgi:hypothetical protein